MSTKHHDRTTSEMPPSDGGVMLQFRTRHRKPDRTIEAAPDAYVSYFENERGEQLVFYRRRTDPYATVWQGDKAEKPARIEANLQPPRSVSLDADELDWLNACRRASGLVPRRLPRRIDLTAEPTDRSLNRAFAALYEQQLRQGLGAMFASVPEDDFVSMLAQMMGRLSCAAATRLIGGEMARDGAPG